ncbi:ribokinase [Thioclava dalianensis]|uniref:Deoxyribokinase n=1 Tax=Thioclava dalianensis TaxID=1185766 RepID=A0A074TEA7_9RHOB|nr:ribokinase [Thioclava dalianensis]KEP70024.1 ribokinase [Thioclava dalianensis]SFN53309.1 ribokinase [Thioclava dalianensis]
MSDTIAVVGSNMMDLVTYIERMPARGETLAAPDFAMGFGGKGANQAVAAARLGSKVAMVTCVGDDGFGAQVRANLESNGIDTTHVRTVEGSASGVAPIFVEPDGENAILIVKGANAALAPSDVDGAAEMLRGASAILLQLEVDLATVYHAVAFGAREGITTILNPAPAHRDLDIAQLDGLDWFCPNESELALLTGLPTDTEADVTAAARHLIARGIRNVVVTLGGRGARRITADHVEEIAPVAVTPVDTTGAGDAFIGAFAHYLGAGHAPTEALTRAARYAALSITRRGTQTSYATAPEFAEFLSEHALD